jgi:Flp pilus assembly protein TadD
MLAPDKADRRFWLGILYAQVDSVPQARREFTRVTELDSLGTNKTTGVAYRQLGFYLLLDRQYPDAVRFLERAVEIDKQDTQAWVWLGQGRQNAGNRSSACEAYQRALQLDATQPDAVKGKQSLGC